MKARNRAVVVGALGVIGRYIVERLQQDESWSVVGLSRRDAASGPRYRHIAVDLLDQQDVEAKLAGLADVTHIFYAAFQAAPGAASGYASNIAPNRDMLVNAVTAIARASSGARARGAGDGHQILRHASGAVQDAGARERSPAYAARLLLRPDRLADRIPEGQGVGLGRAAAADAVRFRAGHADEHSSRDRGLCRREQGAGPAAAVSWQARRLQRRCTR